MRFVGCAWLLPLPRVNSDGSTVVTDTGCVIPPASNVLPPLPPPRARTLFPFLEEKLKRLAIGSRGCGMVVIINQCYDRCPWGCAVSGLSAKACDT